MAKTQKMRPVMVTTKHRGVFGGLVPVTQDMDAEIVRLEEARMAINWGTTRGVMQLCETGPTSLSKISAPATIESLRDITAIFNITPAAWSKWTA